MTPTVKTANPLRDPTVSETVTNSSFRLPESTWTEKTVWVGGPSMLPSASHASCTAERERECFLFSRLRCCRTQNRFFRLSPTRQTSHCSFQSDLTLSYPNLLSLACLSLYNTSMHLCCALLTRVLPLSRQQMRPHLPSILPVRQRVRVRH